MFCSKSHRNGWMLVQLVTSSFKSYKLYGKISRQRHMANQSWVMMGTITLNFLFLKRNKNCKKKILDKFKKVFRMLISLQKTYRGHIRAQISYIYLKQVISINSFLYRILQWISYEFVAKNHKGLIACCSFCISEWGMLDRYMKI